MWQHLFQLRHPSKSDKGERLVHTVQTPQDFLAEELHSIPKQPAMRNPRDRFAKSKTLQRKEKRKRMQKAQRAQRTQRVQKKPETSRKKRGRKGGRKKKTKKKKKRKQLEREVEEDSAEV